MRTTENKNLTRKCFFRANNSGLYYSVINHWIQRWNKHFLMLHSFQDLGQNNVQYLTACVSPHGGAVGTSV